MAQVSLGEAPSPRLSRINARMVMGLPDAPENIEWIREALEALQREDPRPDVDLGGIELRLDALEGRPLAGDLSPLLARLAALEARAVFDPDVLAKLWDAYGALAKRLNALEDMLAALAAQPKPDIVVRDPLDPEGWDSLDAAKAALEVLVTREAARRCGQAVSLYELMVRLDALGDARTPDEDYQLLQHHEWAKERQQVELARLTHNSVIRALADLGAALGYDWKSGWPEV